MSLRALGVKFEVERAVSSEHCNSLVKRFYSNDLFVWLFWTGKVLLYPVFSAMWNFLILPVQLVRLVGNLIGALSSEIVAGLENLWLMIHDAIQLLVVSGSPTIQSFQIVKSSAPSPSMWRTLWNDILSKVSYHFRRINDNLSSENTLWILNRRKVWWTEKALREFARSLLIFVPSLISSWEVG